MSLIIAKPERLGVPKDKLLTAAKKYTDGIGFAYTDGLGKVHVRKGFKTYNTFIEVYLNETKREKTPALICFRNAKTGYASIENCQPFDIGNTAFAQVGKFQHNAYYQKYSSAYRLQKKLKTIGYHNNELFMGTSFHNFLEDITNNCMVFMNSKGNFEWVNMKGKKLNGLWYSENTPDQISLVSKSTYEPTALYCVNCNTKLQDDTEKDYELCSDCLEHFYSRDLTKDRKDRDKQYCHVSDKPKTTTKPRSIQYYGE